MKRLALVLALVLAPIAPAAAGFEEGEAAFWRHDYATAYREWLPLAQQGYAPAQYKLGQMVYLVRGKNSYAEALKWFRLAAEQGHADAQFYLGSMYYDGHGVAQDDGEAAKWYSRAAKQGHRAAQYRLKRMNER
jgi:TPR repeat protein